MGSTAKKSQGLNLLAFVFTLTAFILMWVGSLRCNFVKFVSNGGSSEPVVREFGIWYYQFFSYVVSTDGRFIVATCNAYPDYAEIDGAWKSARAFSILTFIFAIVTIIWKGIISCMDPEKKHGSGTVWPFLALLAIFQGLTLLMLASNACDLAKNGLVGVGSIPFEDKCQISLGAKLNISATAFWFAAAIASFMEQRAWLGENMDNQVHPISEGGASLDEPLVP